VIYWNVYGCHSLLYTDFSLGIFITFAVHSVHSFELSVGHLIGKSVHLFNLALLVSLAGMFIYLLVHCLHAC
jgi:hypothetical protein